MFNPAHCNVEKEIQKQQDLIQQYELELIHYIKENNSEKISEIENKIEKCDENIKSFRARSEQMLSEIVQEEKNNQCTKKKKISVDNLEHNLNQQLKNVKEEIEEEEINQYLNPDEDSNTSHFAIVMTALKSQEEKIIGQLTKIQKIKSQQQE